MRDNKKLTVGFIILAVIVCLLYTLWGQSNTANSIYDAVVNYEGMDVLLGSDEDFTAAYAGDALLAAGAEAFAAENEAVTGVFEADGAEDSAVQQCFQQIVSGGGHLDDRFAQRR